MKRLKKAFFIVFILLIFVMIFVNNYLASKSAPYVIKVEYEQNKLNSSYIILNVFVENNFFKYNKDSWCLLVGENEKYDINSDNWVKVNNGYCSLTVSDNAYDIYVKDLYGNISKMDEEKYKLDVVFDVVLDNTVFYMYKGMTEEIRYNIGKIGNPSISESIEVVDDNIVEVRDKTVVAKNFGKTQIVLNINGIEKNISIVVSPFINKPAINNKRSYVACGQFSKDESLLLDKILYSRIDKAGYQTRAGVVAAARFLTLEFSYRVPYFYENGRLNNYSPYLYVDGEGRYYHRGLYLSEDKYSLLKSKFVGPALWGCNLQNFTNWGPYKSGEFYPNGLDCSGFVTWALLNGGFDVGDIGAGTDDEHYDLTDLGEKVQITSELMNSGKVKVGDLIGLNAHMAILAGIDEENYYIAESLNTTGGVAMTTVNKNKLINNSIYKYIILMDDVYKDDGNLTNMWN